MLALVACLVATTAQNGFDWGIKGENGPLKQFEMTAEFSGNAIPFEGPVPDVDNVEVPAGGRVFPRIEVAFYLAQVGPSTEAWASACGNICQGPPPNHAEHAACNRFCDRPCESTHRFEAQAHDGFSGWRLERVEVPFIRAFTDAARMFRQRGMPVDDNMDWLTTIRDDYIGRANEKAATETYVFAPDHVGINPYQPCLFGNFSVSQRQEVVMAAISPFLVFQARNGNEYTTVAETSMGEEVRVPVSGGDMAINTSLTETGIRCLCEAGEHARLPDLPAIGVGTNWRSFPITSPTKGFQALAQSMKWGKTHVLATGQDMNTCNFEIAGDQTGQVYLPVGTVLVPDDSKTQIMVMMG